MKEVVVNKAYIIDVLNSAKRGNPRRLCYENKVIDVLYGYPEGSWAIFVDNRGIINEHDIDRAISTLNMLLNSDYESTGVLPEMIQEQGEPCDKCTKLTELYMVMEDGRKLCPRCSRM
ncbi:hypothetical protein [Thermoactinomyces sp. DSM 45892]|nr:hypothetical protein [Thermoactinomyces sp. DSM 45892]SDY86375.1 hypothetical protein SAMN05444416_109107 [Thermoactinomyces sp. DSM 45892]